MTENEKLYESLLTEAEIALRIAIVQLKMHNASANHRTEEQVIVAWGSLIKRIEAVLE